MSKNITVQQLAGNQKTYGIDEFRNMVNYTNTTNKGYVRFRLTSEGLKLEKINNKIDFPLSWRSNVSAAHNMAIRTKFLQAMENDLKYMGDAGTTIRNLIITPKKTDGTLDAGKALSRRDIKAVFEKFDAQFNNGVGRQVILNNFMKAAKAVCGFNGTNDDFAQYYLRTDDHGIDHRFTEFIDSKADYANLPPSERMVKSEIEFRRLLHQLENLVDDAKMRLQTENKLKSIATACAKNNGDFGMVISDQDLSVVRSSLVKLLNKAGVEDVDLGFGHKNAGLEMFLKNVLPVVVRQGVENLRELPDMNDQASVEQVLDAEFNIDRIFTLAKEFIEGAKKAVAEPAPDGKSGNAAVDALKELTKNVSKKAKEAAVLMRAREVFVLNMHGANGQNMQLAHQVANMTDDFIIEAKLDLFTATFIKDKFVKVADQVEMPDENAYLQKANECINKIRVAGQLNFGERWKKDPNAKVDANLKLKAGGNAQKFLKEVSDRTVALVNEKGGGVPMYENLMSRTLPAILNQKISNSVKSGGAARVNIDEQAYDDVMARLKTTRDIYCTFRDGKGAVLMEKAISSFTRQIDRLLKKNNIDAQTYNTLLADFTNRIKGGMKRAVEKFFELTPPHTNSDPKEVEKDGLRHLENFFNEEKGEVLADMRQRISTYVITRGFGGEVRNKLLNQLDERVNECAAKLKANGVELKFQDEGTTLTTALTKLYYKVLADQCDSKKIAGKALDDAFVTKVTNAFYTAAKELVNSTNKLADVLDRDMKLMITTATNRLFEKEEPEDPEPLCSEYKPAVGKEGGITKDEYKATKESMENDLAVTLQTKVDELKNNFLRNPEAYSKKNVGDFKSASDLFPNVGKDGLYTEDSILRMQLNTINKKITAVQGWINANGANGEPKLEDTLAADEKARIKAKYESEGPDKKIPANEISNIVERAVKEVLATADKYPLSYATGDKAKFLDRVNKQVQALVDKHVQAYETFREQFVKDAQPILDKYVDALKTETKSGRQVAEEKMLQVLDSISSEKEVPKIKGFATAFDGMLKKLVDEKIDMKMDAFLVYSKKVTSAYEKCMPVFTEAVMKFAREKLLPTKIGADEADIAFLQNKLLPVLREKFEEEIQKSGEKYDDPYNGRNAIALSELKAESFIDDMVFSIGNMNLANPESDGLLMTLDKVGLMSLFSADEATIGAMHKTIATWTGNEGVKKLMSETRQAEMTLVAYGKDSQRAEAAAARTKIAEFQNALRAALLGIKTEVLEKNFKINEVAPAFDIFKLWLKQYELPDLTVYTLDAGKISLEKAAENHFKERIAKVQKMIAENPDSAEPLLSAAYLKEFTGYLNKLGRNVILAALMEKLLNEKTHKVIDDPSNADVYNVRVQLGEADEAQVRRDVTMKNYSDLTATVTHVLDRTKKLLKDFTVTLEQMKRWNELIETEFRNQIGADNPTIAKYNEYAISRKNMMTAFDYGHVSGRNAIDKIVDEVLQEYFGGKDISSDKVIDQNFMTKNGFSVAVLVTFIKDNVADDVNKKIEALKAKAMDGGKPGSDLEPLPNVKQLRAIFRDVAKATVKAIAGTKKSVYAEQLKLIGSKIKKDDKKAVIGKFNDDPAVKA